MISAKHCRIVFGMQFKYNTHHQGLLVGNKVLQYASPRSVPQLRWFRHFELLSRSFSWWISTGELGVTWFHWREPRTLYVVAIVTYSLYGLIMLMMTGEIWIVGLTCPWIRRRSHSRENQLLQEVLRLLFRSIQKYLGNGDAMRTAVGVQKHVAH